MAQETFAGDLKLVIDGSDKNAISKLDRRDANRLPQALLDRLRPAAKVDDYGDIIIWTINDPAHHRDIDRTIQWVLQREKASFLRTKDTQSVRKQEGDPRATKYDPEKHENDLVFIATESTRASFVEDIDRYMYSIRVGLPDLRSLLSRRLCAYPAYVAEIVKLLRALYAHDDVSKNVDPELARFIFRRIGSLRSILVKDEALQAFLRGRIEPKANAQALLHHCDVSELNLSNALMSLRKGISTSDETTALLAAFMETHLGIHDPTLKAPTGPVAHTLPQYIINADVVHTMYQDKRILIATQNNDHGTLHFDKNGARFPYPDNKNFLVVRGDIFVLHPNALLAERRMENSVIVQNERREVGEVFDDHTLVPLSTFISQSGAAHRHKNLEEDERSRLPWLAYLACELCLLPRHRLQCTHNCILTSPSNLSRPRMVCRAGNLLTLKSLASRTMAFTTSLKIIMPGLPNSGAIGMLNADQVNQMPLTLRNDIFIMGDSQTFGDLTLLTINGDGQKHIEIQRSLQGIIDGERAEFLQHGNFEVRRGTEKPVLYVATVHGQSLAFVATRATQKLVRKRVQIYTFSIRAGFPELRALLRREICSLAYPMYADEICFLLKELARNDLTEKLWEADPDLAKFISQRAVFLRDTMLAHVHLLPTLRKFLSPKQRLISAASLAHHAYKDTIEKSIDAIVESVSGSLGEDASSKALLGAFIDNFHSTETVSAVYQAKPEAEGRSAENNSVDPASAVATTPDGGTDSIPRNGVKRRRLTIVIPDDDEVVAATPESKRRRRPRPDVVDFNFNGMRHMKIARPSMDGKFCSISPVEWVRLTLQQKCHILMQVTSARLNWARHAQIRARPARRNHAHDVPKRTTRAIRTPTTKLQGPLANSALCAAFETHFVHFVKSQRPDHRTIMTARPEGVNSGVCGEL
ncbi:hypothetical protein Q7P37_004247 [Cladosporium fusiforme]